MSTNKLSATNKIKWVFGLGILVASQTLIAAPEPRIVGGTAAGNHAYPFMAAIEYSSDNFQFCGGTLIAKNKVLTAAHCVDTSEGVQVRLGTNNRTVALGQTIEVISQVKHSKYNDSTFDYDVAIMTLASNVVLNDNINLIELPEACESLECITGLAKPETKVRVTGWGSTTPDGLTPTDQLRQVDVIIASNTACKTVLGNSVTKRMICANTPLGGKDSCSGDSGGPLFGYLSIARSGLQTGIVSWGEGDCAQAGSYGVYTRISNPEVRSFILNKAGI